MLPMFVTKKSVFFIIYFILFFCPSIVFHKKNHKITKIIQVKEQISFSKEKKFNMFNFSLLHVLVFSFCFILSSSVSFSLRFFSLDELLIEDLLELIAKSLAPAPTVFGRRRSSFGVIVYSQVLILWSVQSRHLFHHQRRSITHCWTLYYKKI